MVRYTIPPPLGGTPALSYAEPPPMWGAGGRSLKIAFAQRIPYIKVGRRSQIFTELHNFLPTPSPQGEGRGGVTKNSIRAANSF